MTAMTKTATIKKSARPIELTENELAEFSFHDLNELSLNVQKAINIAKEREKGDLMSKIKELAAESGLNYEELFGRVSRGVAKFMNPEDHTSTWTGHGRKPGWLVKALEEGKELKDFAI